MVADNGRVTDLKAYKAFSSLLPCVSVWGHRRDFYLKPSAHNTKAIKRKMKYMLIVLKKVLL